MDKHVITNPGREKVTGSFSNVSSIINTEYNKRTKLYNKRVIIKPYN